LVMSGDLVVRPSSVVEVPIGVALDEIAAHDQVAREGASRHLLVLPVHPRSAPASNPEPADASVREWVTLVVDDVCGVPGNDLADGPGPHPPGPVRDVDVIRLG